MLDLQNEVIDALVATPDELLDRLADLPGAIRGEPTGAMKDDGWVFLPGARDADARVLLIAHVDTVADREPTHAEIWQRGSMLTRQKASGATWGVKDPLGADDRAGVAVTWMLRDSGHSILWVDGEESGGWGATAAADSIPHLLEQHIYMVEIDRAGDEVIAFYDGAVSSEFQDFCRDALPLFEHYWGTFTDIAVLGPRLGLCGMNLAAGYVYEHTSSEILFLDALEYTYTQLKRLLMKQEPMRAIRPDPPAQRYGYAPKEPDIEWDDEPDEDGVIWGRTKAEDWDYERLDSLDYDPAADNRRPLDKVY